MIILRPVMCQLSRSKDTHSKANPVLEVPEIM